MRIALANVQLLDGNNVVAPLGVLYIAGQLERDGHTVSIFDGDPDAFPLGDEIAAWRPDVVGLSFLTAASSRAYVLLKKLKARLPQETFFMAGGLPRPARHLIDFTPYLAPPGVIRGYSMAGVATVFATRGCPYGCIYCGSHNIFGRKIRYRPVADIIDEIEELQRAYGARGIYF